MEGSFVTKIRLPKKLSLKCKGKRKTFCWTSEDSEYWLPLYLYCQKQEKNLKHAVQKIIKWIQEYITISEKENQIARKAKLKQKQKPV